MHVKKLTLLILLFITGCSSIPSVLYKIDVQQGNIITQDMVDKLTKVSELDNSINNPYEFALIYNLMRPGIFPTNEAIFNQIYISSSNFASLSKKKKNQYRIA